MSAGMALPVRPVALGERQQQGAAEFQDPGQLKPGALDWNANERREPRCQVTQTATDAELLQGSRHKLRVPDAKGSDRAIRRDAPPTTRITSKSRVQCSRQITTFSQCRARGRILLQPPPDWPRSSPGSDQRLRRHPRVGHTRTGTPRGGKYTISS